MNRVRLIVGASALILGGLLMPVMANAVTTSIDDPVPLAWVALTPTSSVPQAEPPQAPVQVTPKPVLLPSEMVKAEFDDAPVMYYIALAESRFDANARNRYSTAKGLFQILNGTWAAYNCSGNVLNAADNIACARKIYDAEGTRPWNASKGAWQ